MELQRLPKKSGILDHMKNKRVTMREVAALAGVSLKTVSRVVNGEPGVAEQTAEAVKDAINKTGYRVDPQAQALRRTDRRSRTVGLLVSSVANPFDAKIHAALEEVAAEHSSTVLALSSNDDPNLTKQRAQVLVNRQIDGLVFSPLGKSQKWLADLMGDRPVVAFDRQPHGLDVDAVVSDNFQGALRATRHLISGGHRRIAFLGDRDIIETAQIRRAGFERAMGESGVEIAPGLVRSNLPGEEAARMSAHELLTGPEPPTAIFSAQNNLTAGVLRALKDLNMAEQIAVVSFDDLPHAELFKIGLTAITQDPERIGRIAAERLFARLSGDIDGPAETITVPTGFQIRGSGEIKPA